MAGIFDHYHRYPDDASQYKRDMVLTCVGHLYSIVHVTIYSAE
jgi:hypothetical protein